MYIVVLGLSWQQKQSILALKKYNYKIIGVDQNKNCDCKNIVNKFLNIDFKNIYKVYDALIKITKNPNYIFSFNSDAALVPAAKLRKKFNLSGLSIYHSTLMTNKKKLKQFLKKNKFNIVKYKAVDHLSNNISGLKKFSFPLVLKPFLGSGSKNIHIVKSSNELNSLIRTKRINKKNIIIEEFIQGQEYSIEAFVMNRKAKILTLSKRILYKKTTAKEIFTYNIEPKKYDLIKKTILRFINLTKINNCPFHIEIILTKQNVPYIIDAAARGGGYFVADYLVLKKTNFNINRALIDISLKNKKIELDKIKNNENYVYLKYILSKPGRVKAIKKIKLSKVFNIKFLSFKKKGDICNVHSNDSDRLGVIIGYGKDLNKLKKSIQIYFNKKLFDIN